MHSARETYLSLTAMRASTFVRQLGDSFLSPKHQDCLAALAENTSL
jgi:hypothetical protein